MENNLKEELSRFWKWANITPEEYALDKVPEKAIQTEWEYDYPGWPELQKAIDKELNKIKLGQISNFNPVLEAIAIDNEGQYIIDKCGTIFKKETLELLVRKGLDFFLPQTRWQMIFIIENYLQDLPGIEEILIKLIEHDSDLNIQKVALHSLPQVNPKKAEKYALDKIHMNDIFMVLVSLGVLRSVGSERLNEGIKIAENCAFTKITDSNEIIRLNALLTLKQLNSDKLTLAVERLKGDSSLLVQEELKK